VFCVYALTSRSRRPRGPIRATGLRGERLRQVRVGSVDAIVGTLPRPPRPTRDALRRYDRVIRELAAQHPSLLPVRFGMCVAALGELELAFRARGDRLRAALRLVRGRVQMTLRLFGVVPGSDRGRTGVRSGSDRGQSGVRSGSDREYEATQGSGMSGAQYLRTRVAETAIPAFDPLRAAVRRWVKAERVERHDRGRLIASVYHLIPRASADRYRRAVERAAAGADVTMIVSGPWPPYAFTNIGSW
jgi:hypothetical protein